MDKPDDNKSDYLRRKEGVASLLFLAMAFFVGLPIWLRTTTVERHPLPFAEIDRLERLDESTIFRSEEERRTQIPAATEVDASFILVVPNPSRTNVSWSVESAFERQLLPFARLVQRFGINMTLTSQVLYYIDLSSAKDGMVGDKLISDFVTEIENRAGRSSSSSHVILHFVICVAGSGEWFESGSEPTGGKIASPERVASVMLPRWGGIVLDPIKCPANSKECAHEVDLDRAVDVFINHFVRLLGLPKSTSVASSDDGRIWPSDEWNAALRQLSLKFLASAISSLKSLVTLLESIPSMVINEHVSRGITLATGAVQEAQRALDRNDTESALRLGAIAFENAESSFFDPSLLGLLYFPEDQKYAIYIPLFLPIGLPLLMTSYKTFTSLTDILWRRKAAKDHTE